MNRKQRIDKILSKKFNDFLLEIIDNSNLQHGVVELLHDDYDLSRMAGDADTISYEILTQLGSRPARHYQNS